MADYYALVRTNYFAVTDEEKFRNIIAACTGEGIVELFDSSDGSGKFAFGCYGSVSGIPAEDGEPETAELNEFHEALQNILADGDAIIISEIGHEKMRYLVGCCTVITKKDIQYINVQNKAIEQARIMLGKPDFTTQMDY